MALREILKRGDPVLNKKAHPVTKFDDRLHSLLDDLHETLDDAGGAGLAAPQIGILRAVVLVVNNEDEILELVNPTILSAEGEQDGLEGCLSIPGYWGFVKRPEKVRLRAQDRNGNWFEVEGTGMAARCYCHELDHLDGKLYTELASRLYTTEEVDEMAERHREERIE
ncbi:MAG TPA: peptide deformylase [Pseudoflavonifractor sp.]|nr:peptide deformylase [Pseudoflavonifractor sp.]